ncbi:uncharacterized protein EV422DRAFT_552812, partial [Fimicolochytrium jonesii]|uniref:uncharacterized protein n=1 Tax=Fimicolochytrium jonesii TaxID=1396493 RepID=UPI0022FE4A2F
MWILERCATSSKAHPKFSLCCERGTVLLPPLPTTPATLCDLLTSNSPHAKKFREAIRSYNSSLAWTSLGADIDLSVTGTQGVYSFRVHGQICHHIGSLLPSEQQIATGKRPRFAQMYIYDTEHEAENRASHFDGKKPDINIIGELQHMLYEVNPYAHVYRSVRNILAENPAIDISMRIVLERTTDSRRYNCPTADEVAAIMVGDGAEAVSKRQVIVQKQGGGLQEISERHPAYMPLQYPLLFPHGEDGWHHLIPLR